MQFKATGMQLFQKVNGTNTSLDYDGTDQAQDEPYRARIVRDGKRVEVWWGPADGDPALVLETDQARVTGLDRLTFAVSSNAVFTVDDIEFRTPDPSHRLHLYNAANELLWVGGNGVRTAFAYDAWGRAVSKSWAKDPATTYTAAYTWQMGDKLRQIETDFPGERDVWYNYDGLGKRRNKLFADPDDLHWYRWAGWSVLSEYDTTGASGWEIPAAAARVDVAGLAERGAGAAYAYRLHDHLGSVRGLRGASRAPLARHAYAPYGELKHGAGRPLRRGFTGHHWDAESGTYYAPFRYYMPGAGRWLSRDPLGFVDSINMYIYAQAAPTIYTDPLGGYTIYHCITLFPWGHKYMILDANDDGVGTRYEYGPGASKPKLIAPGCVWKKHGAKPGWLCTRRRVTEHEYMRVRDRWEGVRANPGTYNVATNNCYHACSAADPPKCASAREWQTLIDFAMP